MSRRSACSQYITTFPGQPHGERAARSSDTSMRSDRRTDEVMTPKQMHRTRLEKGPLSFVTMLVLLSACSGGAVKDAPTSPAGTPTITARFTLYISRTPGVAGTPSGDSVVVDSGQAVGYNYQAQSGYLPPTVLIDGKTASSNGTVVMTASHALAVGTALVPTGSRTDSSDAQTVRSVVTTSDPAATMQTLFSLSDRATRGRPLPEAASILQRIRSIAYDSTQSPDILRAADASLAGRVFSAPTTAAVMTRALRASQASTLPFTVPLDVLFSNGINTSPVDYWQDLSILGLALGDLADLPHDPSIPVRVDGQYNPSQGVFATNVQCVANALRKTWQKSLDWVTGAQELSRCNDLTSAATDVVSLLVGGDASPDAVLLSAFVKSRLRQGRAVIVVGHSRGTLVAQQAFQLIVANPVAGVDPTNCIGFVSIASPLWQPNGWGAGLSWGTIAAGAHVADAMILYVPSTSKAPSVATSLTSAMDQEYPTSPLQQPPYRLATALQIHSLSSYFTSTPVSASIQQAVRDVANQLQAQCTLRTVAAITLTSGDNLAASVNTSIASPATFTVSDAAGRPVPGVTVHFAVQSGSLVAPADQTTGTDGSVSVTIKTGGTAGAAVLAATVSLASVPPALLHVSVSAPASPPEIVLSLSAVSFSAIMGGPAPSAQLLSITNGGAGTLSGLSINVNYQSGQSNGWLSASLSGTTAPSTITFAATTGSLAAGTYNATTTVSSTAPGVTNSPRTVSVTLIVSSAVTAPTISLSSTSARFTATTGGGNPAPQTLQITNGGTGTLSGLSVGSISYGAGQPTGWLGGTLAGSSAPTSLTLSSTVGALAAGTYGATVSVQSTAPGVTNSPQSISVTLVVAAVSTATGSLNLQVEAVNFCPYLPSDGGYVLAIVTGPQGPLSGGSPMQVPRYYQSPTPGQFLPDSLLLTGLVRGLYTVTWLDRVLTNCPSAGAVHTYRNRLGISTVFVDTVGPPAVATAIYEAITGAISLEVRGLGIGPTAQASITGPDGPVGSGIFKVASTVGCADCSSYIARNLRPGIYTVTWLPVNGSDWPGVLVPGVTYRASPTTVSVGPGIVATLVQGLFSP